MRVDELGASIVVTEGAFLVAVMVVLGAAVEMLFGGVVLVPGIMVVDHQQKLQ